MNARLILVTGSPGSGKSTLAARLVARHGCVLLDKDTIKEALFDTLGMEPPGGSRRLSDASFAVQFALAEPLLAGGLRVLLEGNFRPGEHEAPLGRLLATGQTALAQILVEAPAELRAARLAARAGDPGRHRGHADATAPVPAASTAALALPGALWRIAGDAGEQEWARLSRALDQWLSTSSTSA
jgi:predicted kinase